MHTTISKIYVIKNAQSNIVGTQKKYVNNNYNENNELYINSDVTVVTVLNQFNIQSKLPSRLSIYAIDSNHNDPIVLENVQALDSNVFCTEFKVISIDTIVNNTLFKYVIIVSILQVDGSIGVFRVGSQNILTDNVIVNEDYANTILLIRNQINDDSVMIIDSEFGGGNLEYTMYATSEFKYGANGNDEITYVDFELLH